MTVQVIRNGKRQRINAKVASILEKKGIVQIVRAESVVQQSDDGLDSMSRDGLLKMADDLGIKIHHRTGEERIRETLRDQFK